jgi:biopolymer transport protein ExbD
VNWHYYKRVKVKVRSKGSEFDSSSVADLAFLLLIFFIVTSSFLLPQGIIFTLPTLNSKAIQVDVSNLVEVYPQPKGFRYNDAVLTKKALYQQVSKRLAEHKKKFKKKELIATIHMSGEVPYKKLIEAISVIKEAGIKKVSLKEDK